MHSQVDFNETKGCTQMTSHWKKTRVAALIVAFALGGGYAQAADTFDPATGLITIGSIIVGDTEYRDVVVEIGSLVSYSTVPDTSTMDRFDAATGQLTIRSIAVNGTTFANVVITIKSVRGLGASNPAPRSNVTIKVIDGPIKNAQVCLDKNANGVCDSDEPQGRTDPTGSVTLSVNVADAGAHRVIAVVGTDAVDADHGPVSVAYTMKAPADQPGLISPLTTMVQHTAETSKVSSAQAVSIVQQQTGVGNLMSDYTLAKTPEDAKAATVARAIVVATQERSSALGAGVGTSATGGGTITQADLDNAIRGALLQILPQIVAAASSSAVQTACASGITSAGCATAIAQQIPDLVSQTGLTPITLPVQIGLDKALANPTLESTAPVPRASLDWLQFTDAGNWYYRVLVASAAENTPDAQGFLKFREIRAQNTAGTSVNWGFGSSYARRGDLHFNGTAWVDCPLGTQSTQTVNDAQGRNESWYCNDYSHHTNGYTVVEIAGQTMASVVATIQGYPYSYGTNAYSKWGTSSTDSSNKLALGAAIFPSGSKLSYRTANTTSTAVAYDVQAASEVLAYSASVAAGGDARNQTSHPCLSPETQANPAIPVTTLEQLVAAFKGTPCVFSQSSLVSNGVTYKSDDPNEWSGNSTASIGNIGTAALTGTTVTGFYTTNSRIRVAFTGANAVTYFACKERALNGSPRNCTTIGSGTYAIETLGDARVIKLTNPPGQAAPLTYNRVFVERAGKVYLGYQEKPGAVNRARLNLEATNALFQQIGIPEITP